MFSWFRNRRRRNIVRGPFPSWWEPILRRNIAHAACLSAEQNLTLRNITRILVAEKKWEAARGFVITEEVKVTIAAQAALLIVGMDDHDYFGRVQSVVVYPDAFRMPNEEDGWEEDDIGSDNITGQAVYRGPVILAWDDVLKEGRDPSCGQNLVLHEFAHQLDFLDNAIDGTPPLKSRDQSQRWQTVMTAAFVEHKRQIAADEETFFTEHAADDEAEFFADATEAFYCAPHGLHDDFPDIYALLAEYYNLDPASWSPVRNEDSRS